MRTRQSRNDGETVALPLRLPAETYERLKQYAAASGVSLNLAVSMALAEYLDKQPATAGEE